MHAATWCAARKLELQMPGLEVARSSGVRRMLGIQTPGDLHMAQLVLELLMPENPNQMQLEPNPTTPNPDYQITHCGSLEKSQPRLHGEH
jgi:hypothetical protein